MSLSHSEVEEILHLLSAEGFRFVFDTKQELEVQDLVLKRGELLIVEQEKGVCLKIGNGVDAVPLLPSISSSTLAQFHSSDSAEKQAKKLWQELQSSARMYEVISKTMPKAIQEVFMAQKPENFTFFLGEEMPKKSALYQFMAKVPDLRGCFLRNFDHGAGIDPQGNRWAGSLQQDALQQHAHQIEGKRHLLQASAGSVSFKILHNEGAMETLEYAQAMNALAFPAMKNKAINAQLLKKIVQEAGLCLQIPCENSQALTKWIALAGEPIWLEDKKALCLGDGKTPAEQLRALGTSLESFAPGESAPWLARRLWKELQSSARLYELIFKLLPVQIHTSVMHRLNVLMGIGKKMPFKITSTLYRPFLLVA
ncbi:UNVERIFIED_CONTAM: hypothetical protein PYX00_011934 [Menopon gallinae]|uniref:Uncharacterized protein n=1 Tax=Menopon gallinae TaxID=328185 RepID=A0AAW2H928_9NEOP